MDSTPFDRGKKIEAAQSTRILNPATNGVRVVEAKPMTVTRTARRPEQKQVEAKTLDDLSFTALDIKWSSDFDILSVHATIVEYLKTKKERKELIVKTINAYRAYTKPNITTDEISLIRIKITELEKELNMLVQISALDYMIAVDTLLSEYRELSRVVPRVFGQKEKIDAGVTMKKSQIVQMYLTLAKKYCPMNVTREVKINKFCGNCSGNMIDTGDVFVCSECETMQKKYELTSEISSNDDQSSKRANYESNVNFRDIVMQHQTTYPVIIPERILITIKEAISQYEEFDMTKLTRTDLFRIMREQNLGVWYKHLHKIYKLLTGKGTKDISRHVSNLFKRGDLLEAIYDKIKPADRSNFMHGLYLLWLFLMNEKYEPDIEEFILLKSVDVEANNVEILTDGFEMLKRSNPEFEWIIYRIP